MGMVGTRSLVARGGSRSLAKSQGCCSASTNFAPTSCCLKVSRAGASELIARCCSSHMDLPVHVCFRKKERKATASPGPLCSLHWGSSRVAGPGRCISVGFSSMHGSGLGALVSPRGGEGAGAPCLADDVGSWAGSAGCDPPQPWAGRCGTGWQELPLPARCLHRGEKKPPERHVPEVGTCLWRGASAWPPRQHSWEALGVKVSLQAGLVPDGVVKGRAGTEGSGKGWDRLLCPREERAVGIGVVPTGLCTGQLPRQLCGS